jgi:cell division protein FtsZ
VNEASTIIQNSAHEDANIIFGAVLDESLGDEIKITVIATGFRPDLPDRGEHLKHPLAVPPPAATAGGRKSAVPGTLSNKPRFASEIAEETTAGSAASVNSHGSEKPQQGSSSSPVQQEAAPITAEATPAHNRNDAARGSVLTARAEVEDGHLDVPAYLRRDELS